MLWSLTTLLFLLQSSQQPVFDQEKVDKALQVECLISEDQGPDFCKRDWVRITVILDENATRDCADMPGVERVKSTFDLDGRQAAIKRLKARAQCSQSRVNDYLKSLNETWSESKKGLNEYLKRLNEYLKRLNELKTFRPHWPSWISYEHLRSVEDSQKNLSEYLKSPPLTKPTSLWLVNAVSFRARPIWTKEIVIGLAAFGEVEYIYFDRFRKSSQGSHNRWKRYEGKADSRIAQPDEPEEPVLPPPSDEVADLYAKACEGQSLTPEELALAFSWPHWDSKACEYQQPWGIQRICAEMAQREFRVDGDGVTVAVVDTGVSASGLNLWTPAQQDKGDKPSATTPDHADPDYSEHRPSDCVEVSKGYLSQLLSQAGCPGEVDPETELSGPDFVCGSGVATDGNGHGTQVAGVIGGENIGVAPGSTIMALKVHEHLNCVTEAAVWAAMEYAAEKGAHLINISMADETPPGSARRGCWRTAVERALACKIPVVTGAGNGRVILSPGNISQALTVAATDRDDEIWPYSARGPVILSPGNISQALTVAATDRDDEIWPYSARGPVKKLLKPDLAAPGDEIRTATTVPNSHFCDSGTSLAAPHVSGTLALMLSYVKSQEDRFWGAVKVEDLKWCLLTTARDLPPDGIDIESGFGLINAFQALDCVRSKIQAIEAETKIFKGGLP